MFGKLAVFQNATDEPPILRSPLNALATFVNAVLLAKIVGMFVNAVQPCQASQSGLASLVSSSRGVRI